MARGLPMGLEGLHLGERLWACEADENSRGGMPSCYSMYPALALAFERRVAHRALGRGHDAGLVGRVCGCKEGERFMRTRVLRLIPGTLLPQTTGVSVDYRSTCAAGGVLHEASHAQRGGHGGGRSAVKTSLAGLTIGIWFGMLLDDLYL